MDLSGLTPTSSHRPNAITRVRSERRRTVIILTIVAMICAVSVRFGFFGGFEETLGTITMNGNSASWPDRASDVADSPLGHPPATDPAAGSHKFIATQRDGASPITFDPCAPIHLVVNDRTAIPDGERLVDEAIDEIESATGLVFVLDGTTTEVPSKAREARSERYGAGWAPVLLAWSDADESPTLAGGTAGIGGSIGLERGGHRWFVTGAVTIDGPQLGRLSKSAGDDAARAVIMHELGHVVGLDHVDAEDELMKPEGSPDLTTWGPGDRAGLAALGRGACIDY